MTTVTISASKPYAVKIGSGILSTLAEEIHALGKAEQVLIVSDSNVFPLYGNCCVRQLEEAGFTVSSFVFSAGEQNKNADTYLSLLSALASNHLTRTDCIVALGGGVVGDLAGFAAATYLRGIRYIQIPTTVLAAVDSSVGGKTAIDLPEGKNLAGAFYQPSLVLCDTDTWNTLPRDVFLDGCAEIIKYGILYDPALFASLEETGPDFDRETVITRCVQWKNTAVAEDEFDTGARRKLNLGHTIGHCIEKQSGYSVSHGKAVAIGMAMAARACDCPDRNRILAILKQYDLPDTTDYSARELYVHALSDKKRTGGTVNLILPRAIGNCDIVPIPVDHLQAFLEAGF